MGSELRQSAASRIERQHMKTIGLIGGMSWESTAEYYRIINETVRERLGGLHSGKIVMVSVDFAEIEAMQVEGRWDDAGGALATAARQVESAGADVALICTNTMHRVFDSVAAAVDIPLLHLADATAERVLAALPADDNPAHSSPGIKPGPTVSFTVGLLGTAFTMEQDFYRGRLEQHGLTVLVPEPDDRAIVHRVIYDEVCLGIIREESRAEYERIMRSLIDSGAQGIILGCTEIELLVDPDSRFEGIPLYPTSRIHAEAAVDWALRP
jgi:aspartate racemase